MASLEHEELVELFIRDPNLAIELAKASGLLEIPAYDRIEVRPAEMRDLVPATLMVDALVLLHQEKPVLAMVVEVQLNEDPDKRYSWPFYVAAARFKYKCPACLLVYTTQESIAQWCAKPIDLGQPDSTFRPVVVGRKDVPRVSSLEQAQAFPFLALFSALAHGQEPGSEDLATLAWKGLENFSEDDKMLWRQVLWMGLGDAAQLALKKAMNLEGFKEQTSLFLEGKSKGFLDGKAKGFLEGEAKGEAKGLRVAIEDLCDLLSLPLSNEQQAWLTQAQAPQLEIIRQSIKEHRAWPDALPELKGEG
jgi:hypothetical protein